MDTHEIDLNSLPILTENIRISKQKTRAILFTTRTAYVINETALRIIELCTGDKTIKDIIKSLKEDFFHVEERVIINDVISFLKKLAREGIITIHDK